MTNYRRKFAGLLLMGLFTGAVFGVISCAALDFLHAGIYTAVVIIGDGVSGVLCVLGTTVCFGVLVWLMSKPLWAKNSTAD